MKEKPVIASQELAPRAANGQLQPGARLNPNGRPRGSYGGIRRTIETLFSIANEPEVQARIRAALREEAEKHPFRYARQFILPLTPHRDRKALRAKIRAAEQAAFEQAHTGFSRVSQTG